MTSIPSKKLKPKAKKPMKMNINALLDPFSKDPYFKEGSKKKQKIKPTQKNQKGGLRNALE